MSRSNKKVDIMIHDIAIIESCEIKVGMNEQKSLHTNLKFVKRI